MHRDFDPRSLEVDTNGVIGEPGGAVAAGNRPAQHRADRAVNVAHRQLDFYRRQSFDRRLRFGDN